MAAAKSAGKPAVYTAMVQLMPSMDGFFETIEKEMQKQTKRLRKLGAQYSSALKKGFDAGRAGKVIGDELGDKVKKATDKKGKEAGASGGKLSGKEFIDKFNNAVKRVSAFRLTTPLQSLASQFATVGKQSGYSFAFNFANMAKFMIKRALVGAGLLAAVAAPAQVFAGGLTRALNLDQATATLRGLKHTQEEISSITKSALDSVDGTVYGLDQAVKVASTAMAAGVNQGEELTKYLKSIADAASITNIDLEEMGMVFNKIMANGTVWSQELNMVADRGIPIFAWLAEAYNVSQAEFRKMVEDGQVQSDIFFKVMQEKIGGAALSGAETAEGAFRNLRTAMSRLGEAFWGSLFPLGRELFLVMRQMTDAVTAKFKPAWENLIASFSPGFLYGLQQAKLNFIEFINTLEDNESVKMFGRVMDGLKETIKVVFNTFRENAAIQEIFNFIKANIPSLFTVEGLINRFFNIIKTAAPIASNAIGFLYNAIKNVVAFAQSYLPSIGALISSALTQAGISSLGSLFSNIIVNIGIALQTLAPLISSIIYIFMSLVPVVGTVINVIVNMLPTIVNLANTIAVLISMAVGFVNQFSWVLHVVNALAPAIVGLGVVIGTLMVATKLQTLAKAKFAAATTLAANANKALDIRLRAARVSLMAQGKALTFASVSMRAFNMAIKANPIGFIIGLVMLLIEGITWLLTTTKTGQEIMKNFGQVMQGIGKVLEFFLFPLGAVVKGLAELFNLLFGIKETKIEDKSFNVTANRTGEGWEDAGGGYASIKVPAFATGAEITGPTVGLLGEAGAEYVLNRGVMNKYLEQSTKLAQQALNNGSNANVITINVTPSPGMDEAELANAVARQMKRTMRRS